MESLNISHIHIWLRYLQNEAKKNGVSDAIGYLCSQRFKTHLTVLPTYLAHSISMHSIKQYIIVPFQQKTLNLGYTARKSLRWETVECPRQRDKSSVVIM